MLGKVKRINEEVDLRNCVIGSMDVKALYPSIEIDFAVDKCIEMIIKSESNFEKNRYRRTGTVPIPHHECGRKKETKN